MNVTALHLWYVDRHTDRRSRITIRAGKHDSITRLKTKVAEKLDTLRDRILYYYVVVEVVKADGTPGFRSVVRQTFIVLDK